MKIKNKIGMLVILTLLININFVFAAEPIDQFIISEEYEWAYEGPRSDSGKYRTQDRDGTLTASFEEYEETGWEGSGSWIENWESYSSSTQYDQFSIIRYDVYCNGKVEVDYTCTEGICIEKESGESHCDWSYSDGSPGEYDSSYDPDESDYTQYLDYGPNSNKNPPMKGMIFARKTDKCSNLGGSGYSCSYSSFQDPLTNCDSSYPFYNSPYGNQYESSGFTESCSGDNDKTCEYEYSVNVVMGFCCDESPLDGKGDTDEYTCDSTGDGEVDRCNNYNDAGVCNTASGSCLKDSCCTPPFAVVDKWKADSILDECVEDEEICSAFYGVVKSCQKQECKECDNDYDCGEGKSCCNSNKCYDPDSEICCGNMCESSIGVGVEGETAQCCDVDGLSANEDEVICDGAKPYCRSVEEQVNPDPFATDYDNCEVVRKECAECKVNNDCGGGNKCCDGNCIEETELCCKTDCDLDDIGKSDKDLQAWWNPLNILFRATEQCCYDQEYDAGLGKYVKKMDPPEGSIFDFCDTANCGDCGKNCENFPGDQTWNIRDDEGDSIGSCTIDLSCFDLTITSLGGSIFKPCDCRSCNPDNTQEIWRCTNSGGISHTRKNDDCECGITNPADGDYYSRTATCNTNGKCGAGFRYDFWQRADVNWLIQFTTGLAVDYVTKDMRADISEACSLDTDPEDIPSVGSGEPGEVISPKPKGPKL